MMGMCAANKQSLEVSYAHLSQACPILAVWVADVPKQMFAMFNEVAHQVCATFPCSALASMDHNGHLYAANQWCRSVQRINETGCCTHNAPSTGQCG